MKAAQAGAVAVVAGRAANMGAGLHNNRTIGAHTPGRVHPSPGRGVGVHADKQWYLDLGFVGLSHPGFFLAPLVGDPRQHGRVAVRRWTRLVVLAGGCLCREVGVYTHRLTERLFSAEKPKAWSGGGTLLD